MLRKEPQNTQNPVLSRAEVRKLYEYVAKESGMTLDSLLEMYKIDFEQEVEAYQINLEEFSSMSDQLFLGKLMAMLRKDSTIYPRPSLNTRLCRALKLYGNILDFLKDQSLRTSKEIVSTTTSRRHFKNFIRHKPRRYIQIREIPKEDIRRNLIVHLPLIPSLKFCDTGTDHSSLIKIITALTDSAYQCFNGKIVPLQEALPHDQITTEALKEILSDQNKNLKDYFILDYSTLSTLSYSSGKSLTIDTDNIDEKLLKIVGEVERLRICLGVRDVGVDRLQIYLGIGDSPVIRNGMMSRTSVCIEGPPNRDMDMLTLPKNSLTLCTISIKTKNKVKGICFDNAFNLMIITIKCLDIAFLDFSKLPRLGEVRFDLTYGIPTIPGDIKVLPSRIPSLTFRFSYYKRIEEPEQFSKLVARLKPLCWRIIYYDKHSQKKDVVTSSEAAWADSSMDRSQDEFKSVSLNPMAQLLRDNRLLSSPEGMQKDTVPDKKIHRKYNCLFNKDGSIDSSTYREKILTEIQISEKGELTFIPYQFDEEQADFPKVLSSPADEFTQESLQKKPKGSYIGTIKLTSEYEQWVPLKSRSIYDELKRIDQESLDTLSEKNILLGIGHAHSTQQFFVKLDNRKNSQRDVFNIDLFYEMSPGLIVRQDAKIAPFPLLLEKILKNLDKNDDLHKIINDKEKTNIKDIIFYCSTFKPKEINKDKSDQVKKQLALMDIHATSIQQFMERLIDQAGVCDDRAKAFMVLALYCRIPARVRANSTHAYVEYYDGKAWRACNRLGGARINTQAIKPSFKNIIARKKQEKERREKSRLLEHNSVNEGKQEVKDHKFERTNEKKQEEKAHKFEKTFDPDDLILDESQEFEGWYNALLAVVGHPLLLFEDEQQAWSLHAHLLQRGLGDSYQYIHDSSDLEEFLIQYQVKDSECAEIDGPLLTLFAKKNSFKLLMINLSQLSIASCQGILDPHPTIAGYPVPTGIKIIIICQSSIDLSSLATRVRYVAWPSHSKTLRYETIQQFQQLAEVDEKAVDLYGSSDEWERILVGDQKPNGNGYVWVPGKLVIASQSGASSMCLMDLPLDDPALMTFLKRVYYDKGFYANGKWHHLSKDFTFYISPAPKSTFMHTAEAFDEATVGDKKVFFINAQNYHDLFESSYIEQNTICLDDGLLNKIPPDSTMILTSELSDGEIRRLEENLNQLRLSIKTLSPETSIKTPSSIILTQDVDAAARKNKDEKTIEIYISSTTRFSDLFEDEEEILDEKMSSDSMPGKRVLRFNHFTFELFQWLEARNTLILKGEISAELYKQIEHLFAPTPYLVINGEIKFVSGKIILITPGNKKFHDLFSRVSNLSKYETTWESAEEYLIDSGFNKDVVSDIIQSIKLFYEEANVIISGARKETLLPCVITEELVLKMAQAIVINFDKEIPIENEFLQNYSEDRIIYDALENLAKKYLSNKNTLKTPYGKREDRIHQILEHSCFVGLRGEPGTGKTHFVKHKLPKKSTFWGEKKIIEWLTSINTPNENTHDLKEKKYLIVDEASTTQPGYWDFLKGLKQGTIFYKGIRYTVDPCIQKVIFTDNPENYPGRNRHEFLQQVPKVYFKPYDDKELITDVIFPYLNKADTANEIPHDLKEKIASAFVKAYRLAQNRLPHQPLCVRDVNALLAHFCFPSLPNKDNAMAHAHLVCMEVFSGLFKNPEAQNQYNQELFTLLNCGSAPLCKLPNSPDKSYILPTCLQLFWNNVNRCIVRGGKLPEGARSALLVEGASGVGKSEMMVQALMSQNFVYSKNFDKDNLDHTKIYFHVALGTPNIVDLILNARELSKTKKVVLIIDELNILNELEANVFNSILEGLDPGTDEEEMRPQNKKEQGLHVRQKNEREENMYDFVILASQNSQKEHGRKIIPAPLLSRFDRMYVRDLSRYDLIEIAIGSMRFAPDFNNQEAIDFVDAYLSMQKLHSLRISPRNFFEKIKGMPLYFTVQPTVQGLLTTEIRQTPDEIKDNSSSMLVENGNIDALKSNAIQHFLDEYQKDKPLISAWKNKKNITIEDIIFYAMKNPTDIHGRGGNRTAQILYKQYGLTLEKKCPTSADLSISDSNKKCFYEDWVQIRKNENKALILFNQMRQQAIKEKQANVWRCSGPRSHFDSVKSDPDTQTSLVRLIELSNPSYFSRVLGTFGIFGFYSGTRTHQIFMKKDSDSTKCFNIDTRGPVSSDVLAKQIIYSHKG